MKHTKGPWSLNHIVPEQGDSFQEIQLLVHDADIKEREANARLIATAPEMLEVLCMVSVHLNELGESQLWDKVTQVINKARGE